MKEQKRELIQTSKLTLYNYIKELELDGYSLLGIYHQFIQREDMIYQAMNGAHAEVDLAQSLVWIPQYKEKTFKEFVDNLSQRGLQLTVSERQIDKELTVPTMFRQTEFGAVYQQIVDTYGVPNYKEANPALFTGVTFPFLFGVMFGDVMHGGMLLAFALWIFRAGKQSVDGLSPAIWPIRHFILLMGIFATFCGFCYNDYGSIPLYLFGRSCYDFVGERGV